MEKKEFLNCDDCDWESLDEMWDEYEDTYMWHYFCRESDGRRIRRDENEAHPEWCPLINKKET